MNALLIKIIAVAVLALGLFGTGGVLAWKYQAGKVTVAQERVEHLAETIRELQEARHRAEVALSSARAKRQALQAAQAALQPRVNSSLSANREWADTPVPKEVQDVLQ